MTHDERQWETAPIMSFSGEMNGRSGNRGRALDALLGLLCALMILACGCAAHIPESTVPITFDEVVSLQIEKLEVESVAVRCAVKASFKKGALVDEFTVTDVAARIAIDGEEVGLASRDEMTLERDAENVTELTLRLPYAKVTKKLLGKLAGGTVAYSAAIGATAPSLAGARVETSMQGKLTLPKDFAPAVTGALTKHHLKVKNARILSMTMKGVDLAFDVEVNNPFPFPLYIKKVSYQALLSGLDVGLGKYAKKIKLKSGKKTRLKITHHAPPNPIALMALVAQRPPYRVQITGTVNMKPIGGIESLPFDLEVSVPKLDSNERGAPGRSRER